MAEINLSQLTQKLRNREEIVLKSKIFSPEFSQALVYIIRNVLAEHDLIFLQHVLYTLLKEVCNNASKANQKRIYFEKNGIDIQDPSQYAEAMKIFKSAVIENRKEYDDLAEGYSYYIELKASQSENEIKFQVFNNAVITKAELERITSRIEYIKKNIELGDIFEKLSDETEGAGLGLALNLVLMQNSGIGIDNFLIQGDEQGTFVTVVVPTRLQKPDAIIEIEKKIFAELSSVPTFSDAINNIIRICDDPDSQIHSLIKEIGKDPSIASNILKLANSSSFSGTEKVDTLQKAATKIGLKGIKEMTMAVAADRILNEKYKQLRGFWDHSLQCAVYAKKIANMTGMKKIEETVYLGGLLHDIGKLVLNAIDPSKIEGLEKFFLDRSKNSSALLEEITMGISHTEIGSLLAEKWNFSEIIYECIRDHHFPLRSREENRKAVAIVHIANSLLDIEKGRSEYTFIDLSALELLKLGGEKQVQSLHEKVKAG